VSHALLLSTPAQDQRQIQNQDITQAISGEAFMKVHNVQAGDASIPCIGLGTWSVNGAECSQAVTEALNAGYRHIDTASAYGNEKAVGEGIRASEVARDDIFLTTKVAYPDVNDGDLQRSAEISLRRLGVSDVDLLLIHWPNPAVPVRTAVKALCEAKRLGYARHIGVSNFTLAMVEEAVAAADEPLCVNQCEYHVRLDQSRMLASCRSKGMGFEAYSPLGRGAVLDNPAVQEIARSHGRTPGQIVLRWLVQQKDIITIPRSTNPQRIRENLAIFDFTLSESEMTLLSALAVPNGRVVSPPFAPVWDE
jgi:diketogulonate reductase-like aldo/keto reductase